MGSLCLLQWIFPTQEWNQGLLHCRQILYRHQGSHWTYTSESHSVMTQSWYSPWDSPGQNTGVDSCSLLQGIFLTQGSNPGLSHCRQILYHLSHHAHLKINPARPLGGQWDRLPMTSVNHTGLSDFCSH